MQSHVFRGCLKNVQKALSTCSGELKINYYQTTHFQTLPNWLQQFEFDENGEMFTKRIENIVGKGEIACYEQFLLFPTCFQKTCTTDT